MKLLIKLIVSFTFNSCFAQVSTAQSKEISEWDVLSKGVFFFEDFNDNKRDWTVGLNKNVEARIDSGFYFLKALGHAYGEAQSIAIDTRRDFEIDARIKIVSGKSEHKHYYSMIFWGRDSMNSHYLTFARDGFASVELCDGKHQIDCRVKKNSLQKTIDTPDDFNIYRIRKVGDMYSFFVNGLEFYQMPFVPFFGNLVGFGSGRQVTLAIDYLKASYL